MARYIDIRPFLQGLPQNRGSPIAICFSYYMNLYRGHLDSLLYFVFACKIRGDILNYGSFRVAADNVESLLLYVVSCLCVTDIRTIDGLFFILF
jgi:hypothetical protein